VAPRPCREAVLAESNTGTTGEMAVKKLSSAFEAALAIKRIFMSQSAEEELVTQKDRCFNY
jgi:hypothetical protein